MEENNCKNCIHYTQYNSRETIEITSQACSCDFYKPCTSESVNWCECPERKKIQEYEIKKQADKDFRMMISNMRPTRK